MQEVQVLREIANTLETMTHMRDTLVIVRVATSKRTAIFPRLNFAMSVAVRSQRKPGPCWKRNLMEETMGKIKDAIIKRLGGHTEKEWFSALAPAPVVKTVTNVDTIFTHVSRPRYEVDMMGFLDMTTFAKKQLICEIAKCIEPYVEFKIVKERPPRFDFEMAAKLWVVIPPEGRYKCDD